tara:strand:+ start:416 stop:586 length:171 start_codon:yes stop_codon:yes gene_type:complete
MVEYENKMAQTTVKDVVEAIIPEPEIEVRRGKYRIRKNGQLLKFDTREEAEEALAE